MCFNCLINSYLIHIYKKRTSLFSFLFCAFNKLVVFFVVSRSSSRTYRILLNIFPLFQRELQSVRNTVSYFFHFISFAFKNGWYQLNCRNRLCFFSFLRRKLKSNSSNAVIFEIFLQRKQFFLHLETKIIRAAFIEWISKVLSVLHWYYLQYTLNTELKRVHNWNFLDWSSGVQCSKWYSNWHLHNFLKSF